MANGSAGSIYVDLLLRDANYVQGLNKAADGTKSATGKIASSFKSLAPAIIGAASAVTAGFTFNKVIQNTINFQNEQAQLAAVLRSTGNAAGYTASQLNVMAANMASDSIFSPGEINRAQTRLLSYAGIIGDNIPRAMQAVIDQSARLGISVEQSAETIGRALEQPSKAAAALSRQGFGSYFTEEVKETLKALEDQGRMVEAQAKILEVLEESYAGAAKAARETLGGALTGLGNAISDSLTSERGFPFLTKSVNNFSGAISKLKIDDIVAPLQRLAQVSAVVALGVGTKSVAAFAAETQAKLANVSATNAVMVANHKAALAQYQSIQSTVALTGNYSALSVASTNLTRASLALAASQNTVSLALAQGRIAAAGMLVSQKALALVGGPIGAVTLALGAAYVFLGNNMSTTQRIAEKYPEIYKDIATQTNKATESTRAYNKELSLKAANDYNAALKEAQKNLRDINSELSRPTNIGFLESFKNDLLNPRIFANFRREYDDLQKGFRAGKVDIDGYGEAIQALREKYPQLEGLTSRIYDQVNAWRTAKKALDDLSSETFGPAAPNINLPQSPTMSNDAWKEFYDKNAQYIRGVSTEVIRLEEFEKQLILARDAGRISQEEYNKILDNYKNSMKSVTSAANDNLGIYERYEKYIRGVTDGVIQLETAERDLEQLRKAGRISQDEMTFALARYSESLNETKDTLDDFSKKAAENIQDAFADFLFDPFDQGLKGMAKGFVDTVRKMIAEAQAAQLAKWLFGGDAGGSGSGILSGALGALGSVFGMGNTTKLSSGETIKWNQPKFFADGGYLGPGKWGVAGEEGAELIYGGNKGLSVFNQDQVASASAGRGNVYNIDARGADSGAVLRMEQALLALAGPGVIEKRVVNAQTRGSL